MRKPTWDFWFLGGMAIVSMAVPFSFLSLGYTRVTLALAQQAGVEGKLSVIRSQFLTETRFFLVCAILAATSLCFTALATLDFRHPKFWQPWASGLALALDHWRESIRCRWKELEKPEKNILIGVVIVLTAIRLWLMFDFPLHIDEAFSYVFLVSKGLLTTLTYYPGPNNHVGYLFFSSALSSIGTTALWAMRLPALIISLGGSLIFFFFLLRFIPFRAALFALLGFSCSGFGLFYAIHGRGYFLLFTCVIAWLDALMLSVKSPNKALFSVGACIVAWGFFTIPTFVYAYMPVALVFSLWIFKENGITSSVSYIVFQVFAGIFTIMLYLPILIVSGWDRLSGNSWVAPMPSVEFWQKYPTYLCESHAFFYGDNVWLALLSVAAIFIWINFYRSQQQETNKLLALMALTLLIFPWLLLPFQQVLPFTRTWFYLHALEWVAFGILFHHVIKTKILAIFLFGCICVFGVLNMYAFYQQNHDASSVYRQAKEVSKWAMLRQESDILVTDDVYNVYLRLENLTQQKNKSIEVVAGKNKADIFIKQKNKKWPIELNHVFFKKIKEDDWVEVWGKTQ